MRDFKCLLCGATELRPWLIGCSDYYTQTALQVDYFECKACMLIQQCPLPNDISLIYRDYPIHASRNLMQSFARRIFHRQVYFQPTEDSVDLNLLDYGCGNGSYLCDVRARFKSIYGFEPGSVHSDKLSESINVPVYSSSDALVKDLAGKIDVITAHFVLEHVSDLHTTFKNFQELMSLRGMIYVAVPNIRSWEARLFKKVWHGLDAPRHLVFLEPRHFRTLADYNGLRIESSTCAAFPNTLAASLATVLSGHCNLMIMKGLILPCWLVSLCAPQGTHVVRLVREKFLAES